MTSPTPSPRRGRRRTGAGRSLVVWLAALVLAGGAPCTTFAWRLAGKPDRADASRVDEQGETAELWESLDAEETVGGTAGLGALTDRITFAATIGERNAAAPGAAAVTRWRCLRLPRPPPATR